MIYLHPLHDAGQPSPYTAWLADGRAYMALTHPDHGALEVRARSRIHALQIARRWSRTELAARPRIRAYETEAGGYRREKTKMSNHPNRKYTKKQIAALAMRARQPIFQDSYGNGIAFYDNQSFKSWRELDQYISHEASGKVAP